MYKTLLLNASYEVLNFVTDRRALKLLFKEDKVEVIANWEHFITWSSGKIKHPAILRLKNHVRVNYCNLHFSRRALVNRDKGHCQYCHKKLTASQITIDHVVPKVQGGITSFTNCVVACYICNNKKADRTPDQAGMTLLQRPAHPSFSLYKSISVSHHPWNSEWEYFLGTSSNK